MEGEALCKTCGGEIPNHRPSMLDRDGIGNPAHRVKEKSFDSVMTDVLNEYASAKNVKDDHNNVYYDFTFQQAKRAIRQAYLNAGWTPPPPGNW